MDRVTRTMRVDPVVWKKFKKKCVDLDVDMSDRVEDLIRKDLRMSSKRA